MKNQSHCAQCGAPLSEAGAACPRCLLATGLESANQPRLAPGFLHELPLPGDMLVIADKYRVIETIGRGAMGVVYKANQENLGRVVAVKMLTSGALAGEEARQRFVQEAKHAASLRHPNIVTIHDWGEDRGQPYFSMEYVEGRSLSDLVRDGPLEIDTAVRLLRTIAGAVSYAHEQGIVHRDLKPSNVLLDGGGEPKVADFGLAKQLSENKGLTLDGQVLGTPGYLAPEQASARHGPVGAHSDVYALGAVFYCLLTGKPPFSAGTIPDTLRQVMEHDPVPLRRLNPAVPRDLGTICLKCLEKEPGRRYASASALARDLARWERGKPIHARPVGWGERAVKWTRRHPALAGACAAAVAFLLLGLAGLEWGRRAAIANVEMAKTNAVVLSAQLARANASADRFQMEQVQRALDRESHSEALAQLADLLRRSPSNTAAVSLTFDLIQRGGWREVGQLMRHERGAFRVSFKGDGQEVLSTSFDGTAQRWDATTRRMIGAPLVHDPQRRMLVQSGRFSLDGQRILTVLEGGAAQCWDVNSGRPIGEPLQFGMIVATSSDGQWLTTHLSARIWDATTGEQNGTLWESSANHAGFSPDRTKVVAAIGDNVHVWDARTRISIGSPMRHSSSLFSVGFSPDAGRVLSACYDGTARVWDVASGQPIGQPMHHDSRVFLAIFSPDGLSVLTVPEDRMVRLWDARTMQPIGQPMRHPQFIHWATFSPDGQRVATASEDGVRIWEVQRNQAVNPAVLYRGRPGAVLEMTHVGRWAASAEFSPSGRWATPEDGGRKTVRIWPAEGEKWPGVFIRQATRIDQMRFTSNSRIFVTASKESRHTLRLFETQTGELVGLPIYFDDNAESVAMSVGDCSRDGRYVALRTEVEEEPSDPADLVRCVIQVWDVHSAQPLGKPIPAQGQDDSPTLAADGRRLITGLTGKTLRVHDTVTGQLIGQPLEHERPFSSAALGPDDRTLFVASEHWVEILDIGTGQAVGKAMPHDESVRSLELSPDGKRLATVSGRNTVQWWDALTGETIGLPTLHDKDIAFAGFGPDGREVVIESTVAPRASYLDRYRNRSNLELPSGYQERFGTPREFIRHRGFAAVRSLESGSVVRIWDVEKGQLIGKPLRFVDAEGVVDCSSDGALVLIGTAYGRGPHSKGLHERAQMWSTTTGTTIGERIENNHWRFSAALAPDGQRFVTASQKGHATVWDSLTGRQVGEPLEHGQSVNSAAFSPDSRLFVTTSGDGTAKLWDSQTRQPWGNVFTHEGPVLHATFSPDGRRLLTRTQKGLVRVWDVQSGALTVYPFPCDSNVSALSLTPDGKWIWALSDADNLPRLIPLPPSMDSAPAWLPSLAESVGGLRLTPSGALDTAPPIDRAGFRKAAETGNSSDRGTGWLRWFLAPSTSRTLSSESAVTIPTYVQNLIEENSLATLSEAVSLLPNNGLAFARLALARWLQNTDASDRSLAEFHSLHSLRLNPESLDVALTRLRLLQRGNRFDEALAWSSNMLARFPSATEARLVQGQLLAATNRWGEALLAFNQVLKEVEVAPSLRSFRTLALKERRRSQSELGQTELAIAEFEAAHGIPSRSPNTPSALVDLTGFLNAGLARDWTTDADRPTRLSSLRPGVQELGGIRWDIRGVVQLQSHLLGPYSAFPQAVPEIKVGRKCSALHVLYGVRLSGMRQDSDTFGEFRIGFAKSSVPPIPIMFTRARSQVWVHLLPRRIAIPETFTGFGYKPDPQMGRQVRLMESPEGDTYLDHLTWKNPWPEKEIQSIGFHGSVGRPMPALFLVAITVEE